MIRNFTVVILEGCPLDILFHLFKKDIIRDLIADDGYIAGDSILFLNFEDRVHWGYHFQYSRYVIVPTVGIREEALRGIFEACPFLLEVPSCLIEESTPLIYVCGRVTVKLLIELVVNIVNKVKEGRHTARGKENGCSTGRYGLGRRHDVREM